MYVVIRPPYRHKAVVCQLSADGIRQPFQVLLRDCLINNLEPLTRFLQRGLQPRAWHREKYAPTVTHQFGKLRVERGPLYCRYMLVNIRKKYDVPSTVHVILGHVSLAIFYASMRKELLGDGERDRTDVDGQHSRLLGHPRGDKVCPLPRSASYHQYAPNRFWNCVGKETQLSLNSCVTAYVVANETLGELVVVVLDLGAHVLSPVLPIHCYNGLYPTWIIRSRQMRSIRARFFSLKKSIQDTLRSPRG